jgi:predicted transcriptional regulator
MDHTDDLTDEDFAALAAEAFRALDDTEAVYRDQAFLAGIKEGREQARRGEGIPAEDVRKLIDLWAGK